MHNESKKIGCYLTLMLLMISVTPIVDASSNSNQPPKYAFLPSWTGEVGGVDPTGESFGNGLEFNNHDFDEEGNMYYIEADQYAQWMGGDFYTSSRGFHILKIDNSGEIEYSETISCSNYCNNPDYAYNKVVGIHVIGEDEFYVVLSTYNIYLTFDGQQQSSYGRSLTTAFYSNGSWDFIEIETSYNTYAYSDVVFMETDAEDNLYIVKTKGNSNSWTEYEITSYSPSGTNWARTLEIPSVYPTYNNLVPFFDINDTNLNIFATAKNSIKYDYQPTPNCANGESGYCHIWMEIDSAGVQKWAHTAPYTSITYRSMMVQNNTLYLAGNTLDYVVGSNTESNFSGQKISHSPNYGEYIAVMDGNGSWAYTKMVNTHNNNQHYAKIIDIKPDGNFVFSSYYSQSVSLDGSTLNKYRQTNGAYEYITMEINPQTGLQWKSNIGFSNINTIPEPKSDGLTMAFAVTKNYNDELYYFYQGKESYHGTGSTSRHIFWLDLEDGKIVDFENSTDAGKVTARSPEGGVLVAYGELIQYFMPDFDGDNIGGDDNCPETYNPGQYDYNQDGAGDLCDSDDDSDGIEDVLDYCPRGEIGWTSDIQLDYDQDGCKDNTEEDMDDDNDGVIDSKDSCPLGFKGAGNDLDGDGCKDMEDTDDDGDNVRDESDQCDSGEIDWSSGFLTDHDGDGCKDNHSEDTDDDNDGIEDVEDDCPKGATNWPSNINTDFDGDGCKDSFEDIDDDNDGITNDIDDCPMSIGPVNTQGCSATQVLENDGESNVVYYVCPVGSIVVLNPSDCPVDNNTVPDNNDDNNQNSQQDDTFYYVCPGGVDVVTDLSECEGTITEGGTNITLVVDPNSNSSNNYITCEGGKAIVLDSANCPENTKDSTSSNSEDSNSDSSLMILFMGGTFAMSAIAVLVVLFRKPTSVDTNFSQIESSDSLFKDEKEIPKLANLPPYSSDAVTNDLPSKDMIGTSHEGKEWIEWPAGSNTHYYREIGYGGDWTKFD